MVSRNLRTDFAAGGFPRDARTSLLRDCFGDIAGKIFVETDRTSPLSFSRPSYVKFEGECLTFQSWFVEYRSEIQPDGVRLDIRVSDAGDGFVVRQSPPRPFGKGAATETFFALAEADKVNAVIKTWLKTELPDVFDALYPVLKIAPKGLKP